jgi:hypothetical protein
MSFLQDIGAIENNLDSVFAVTRLSDLSNTLEIIKLHRLILYHFPKQIY